MQLDALLATAGSAVATVSEDSCVMGHACPVPLAAVYVCEYVWCLRRCICLAACYGRSLITWLHLCMCTEEARQCKELQAMQGAWPRAGLYVCSLFASLSQHLDWCKLVFRAVLSRL